MSKRKDPGTDPRIYSGHPSIREKLWRQYNAALENDAPIDPTLDELLFGSTDDEPYYELPLLQKVKPNEREPRRDEGAAGPNFSHRAVNRLQCNCLHKLFDLL